MVVQKYFQCFYSIYIQSSQIRDGLFWRYTLLYIVNETIMLHNQIREEIKDAMRAKDELRKEVLRGILTGFTNELVATKHTPQEILDDAGCIAVIKRQVKQRKDAFEQFTNGGRPELAQKEKDELVILEAYLPQTMGREEIKKIAEKVKADLGVTDKSGMGKFIGAVMKACGGQADGNDVKAVAEELLA